MKLSVCIPVYNFSVGDLVEALAHEILRDEPAVEIIVVDDGSDEKFKTENRKIKNCRYHELPQNVGRSAVRNLFLGYANGDYLLFLDCDAKVISDSFLQDYLAAIDRSMPAVLYGGFVPAKDEANNLRYRYSLEREIHPMEYRLKHPYEVFKTINFAVRKDIFRKFHFDECIRHYGYEDFVFAKTLEENSIDILQLDNPVLHDDRETNEIFLRKTERAVRTLAELAKSHPQYVNDVRLLKAAQKLRKTPLLPLLFSNTIFRDMVKRKLLIGNASLRWLDLWKLGMLLRLIQHKTVEDGPDGDEK
ncbi:MAG: glycosyltransferase family 2 protein [Chryseobacterium sp.]|nr:MAG: glycosyltransferase family 2 protein [Chryseobacterium sp.]